MGNIGKIEIDLACDRDMNEIEAMLKVVLETDSREHFNFTGKDAGSGLFELNIGVYEDTIVGNVIPQGKEFTVGEFALEAKDLAGSKAEFIRISGDKTGSAGAYAALIQGIHKGFAEAHIEITGKHKDILAGKVVALLRESLSPSHEITGTRPDAEDYDLVIH